MTSSEMLYKIMKDASFESSMDINYFYMNGFNPEAVSDDIDEIVLSLDSRINMRGDSSLCWNRTHSRSVRENNSATF